jgi:hypothetical protein
MDRSQASFTCWPRSVSIASIGIAVHEAVGKPSTTPALSLVVDNVGNDGGTVGARLGRIASHVPDPVLALGPLDRRLN